MNHYSETKCMTTKTILITGATDGIGMQTALDLARQGHHILVHGRNATRGQKVVEKIQRATKNERVDLLIADLSEMQQVRQLASDVQTKYPRLDVLINNAGVFMKERVLTPDGFETTFAVNHLAPFLLTNLLLDLLKASAPARVVTVSSMTHHNGQMEWDNLQAEKHFNGLDAYTRSKLANVLFAYALTERVRSAQITSNAMHPGVIATKLLQQGWGGGGSDLTRGSQTSAYLATSPQLENVTGKYFVNKREAPSSKASQDRDLQETLWETSVRLVNLKT
jgi:retinol dehydrogenase 14